MNLNKIFLFLFLFLSFLALSIYVFKYKEVSYIDKHFSLKENILEKTKETKKIEKNKKLRILASKKDSEEKRTNTQAEKRKEKLGIKPIDGTYKSLSFSIADVSEEEINRWRVQDEEPEGFALSSLVLKVNKRALLENEKLQIALNKKEFLEIKRLDFDLTNEDSFVWQGSSENKLDSKASSNVLLSWYKGHLTGYLNLSREESYQISYFKKDYIIIRKLNPSFFPKEQESCFLHENKKTVSNKNDIMYKDSFSLSLSKNGLQRASENVRDKKIRILFLYRGNEYNINTITSKVNAYISSLNGLFKNTHSISQNDVFESAGIEVTQYNSGDLLNTLDNIINDSKVRKLRYDYKADLISTLVKSPVKYCGSTNALGGRYFISAIACDYRYTFEHELGHSLGANHERKLLEENNLHLNSTPAYGYYNEENTTIMAYYCWDGNKKLKCDRIKKYSSANANFIGNEQNDVAGYVKNNLSGYKVRYENWIEAIKPKIYRDLNPTYNSSPGSRLTLSVSASGTSLSYQWYKDNQVLNGETNRTLSITKLNSSHAGKYKVKVSNDFASIYSREATLVVESRPTITSFTSGTYSKLTGSRLTLSVSASGTGLSYQWYKDNQVLNGETNRTLSITNLNSSHAGKYKVKVSNNLGSVFSNIATLNVGNRPTITTNLNLSYQKSPGGTVTFSVSATGTGSLSYQWYQNAKTLSGKTNSTLKLTNLSSSHAGKYKVKVSNAFGSTYSRETTLNVGNRPTITTNLNSTYEGKPGSRLTLSVTATGTGSLSYQWYQNAKPLSGKTNSTLKLTNLSSSHAGSYKVKVSNAFGSTYSREATLVVGNRPTITTNLNLSYQKSPGETVTFSVSATGTGSLSYQWYQNAKPLSGKTNSTLKLTNLSSSHAGKYKVKVSNAFGSTYSRETTLNVGNRPTITTNLNSTYEGTPGSRLTLSVTATGTGSLSYQWYQNAKPLSGKTNRVLSIANLSSSHAGKYKVKVSNAFGSTYSREATLVVGNRPTITTNLNLSYQKSPGETVTFSVTATGTGSLSYQWYQNAKTLSGKTNRVLSIANLNNSHAGSYKVKVSNAFGSTYSKVATLSVGTRPTITTNLNSTYEGTLGSRLTLSVTATGSGSLSYQWYQNAKTLSGKTNSTLKLTNLSSSHAGKYKVKVSNAFGSTYSRETTLNVGNRPTITTNLNLSYQKSPGETVTFSVSATGTGSLSYQWYKGNSKLSGKTNRTLSIANLNSSHAGNYKVEVKNNFGSTYSKTAALAIGNRPTITTNLNSTYEGTPGSRLTLSVTATGSGSLSYQWYKGNSKLSGKTNRVLSIANLNNSHAGNYKVEVKNNFGSTYSKVATLSVGNPPTITTDLKPSYKFLRGSTSAFLFVVTTGNNLSYQWYKNNAALRGETNSSLILTKLNNSHGGNYKVKVSNGFATISSRTARLELGEIQINNLNPRHSLRLLSGSNLILSVTATGTGTLSYQWYKNYQALNGKTSSSLKLTKLQISQGGLYTVEVKNDFGSIVSTIAQLSVGELKITKDLKPVHRTVSGSDLTLSVTATGSATLSYQWNKNNVVLNGETSPNLILRNFSISQEGNYRVEVKNVYGKKSSIISRVQMLPSNLTGTSIYLTPRNLITKTNESFVLRVDTEKQNIKRYIWYRDEIYMATTNEPFYTIETGSISQDFSYKVIVEVEGKHYSSNIATVSVIKPLTRNISSENVFDLDTRGGFELPPQQWHRDSSTP